MQQQPPPAENANPQHTHSAGYPHGRGYGHDYMRGGEVFGGYGYSERDDYERRRGEPDVAAHRAERRRTEDGES